MSNIALPYKVIPAMPSDAGVLSSISRVSKAHWGYPEEWIELWKDDLTIRTSDFGRWKVWKLIRGEEIIGFVAISFKDEYYEIEHLWILPEWIGKGLGRELLQYGLNEAVPEGAMIRVISDPFAEGFYERMGFRKIGEVPSRPAGRVLGVMEMEW